MFLSLFDLLQFGCYLATINILKDKEHQLKNNRNLCLFRLQRFGNTANPDKKKIKNVSDYKLCSTEEFVLSHGLNFCFSPTHFERKEIFAKFKVIFAQLQHHLPCSMEKHSALNARLSDLAHAYYGTPIDVGDFVMQKECITVNSLRSNNNIVITKPDKGSTDYRLHK